MFLNHSGLNDLLIRVSMTGYEDWEKLVGKNETSVFVNLSRKNLTLKYIFTMLIPWNLYRAQG